MSEQEPSVLRSTAYNFVAQNSAAIFGALSSIVVARHLGSVHFGQLSYAMWLAGTLTIASTLGLPGALTRFVADHLGAGDTQAATAVLRRIALIAGATALAVLTMFVVEERLFGMLEARLLLPIVVALCATGVALSLLTAAALGMKRMRVVALQSLIVHPLQFVALLVLLPTGAGVRQVLWLYAAGYLLSSIILAIGVRPTAAISPPDDPAGCSAVKWNRVRGYVATLSAITLIDAIVWQRSEIFFLNKLSTTEAVGHYHLAYGLSQILIRTIGMALLGVLMPYFSGLHGAEDRAGVARLFASSTRWLAFFTLPLVAAGTALAPNIVTLLYGTDYLPVATALPILLVSAAAGTIAGGGAALLYGVERQGVILRVGAATAMLNIALDVMLIPRFHLIGAAWANAAAQLVAAVVGVGYIVRQMRIDLPRRALAVTAVASLMALAVMLAMRQVVAGVPGAAVVGVLGAVVYVVAQRLLGFYEDEDRVVIERIAHRLPNALARLVVAAVGRG